MNIITGYRGAPHITSAQDRAKNQGVIGEGSYILDVGQKLAADIVSANEVRVRDGVLSHQGCVAVIEAGAYDSLAISNGAQGMLRTDLIVARYTKDAETNIEDISLVVIEGEAAESSPVAPAYNTGNIQNGDTPVDMPLYQVNISGVSIDSITPVAQNAIELSEALDRFNKLPSSVEIIADSVAHTTSEVNSWEYTGLSMTVPNGARFVGTVRQSWTSGRPVGLALHNNSTAPSSGGFYFQQENDTAMQAFSVVLVGGTYHVFTKRTGTVGSNTYNIYGLLFNF